jgi:hypothetical protein
MEDAEDDEHRRRTRERRDTLGQQSASKPTRRISRSMRQPGSFPAPLARWQQMIVPIR